MIRLKLMADFGCWPLWNVSPKTYGTVDPESLPISDELKKQLLAWAAAYDEILDEIYPPDSHFKTPAAEVAFKNTGRQLGKKLQEELGNNYQIICHPSLQVGN